MTEPNTTPMKTSLKNDYSEGAHPRILNALTQYNSGQQEGYGLDQHCLAAAAILQKAIGDTSAEIHFLAGGTQTNMIALAAFLRPYEACICATSGHVATHETGAIEATGHKLLTIDTANGKIAPQQIEPVLQGHSSEHMVKPAMVYISNPTELGTIYTQEELDALFLFCQKKKLALYLDGARLGNAIMTKNSGLSLSGIYRSTDAFFIGGTKNGALLGEALIFSNQEKAQNLRYLIKQRGAMLAKGRILGIQFEELFRDDLYFQLAAHANAMAQRLAEELGKSGCQLLLSSPTNQIFPIFRKEHIHRLEKEFSFYLWQDVDTDHAAIRLVTSWATQPETIEHFLRCWREMK